VTSVEKRSRNGATRWYARFRDPSGQQRSRVFDRKIDATRFLATTEAAKLTGAYIDTARAKVTVGTVAAQWQAGKVNLKPTTRARYDSALNVHVLPRWRSTPLDRVEHGDGQAWLAELSATGQSGASVRKAYGVLAAVLDLAVRTGVYRPTRRGTSTCPDRSRDNGNTSQPSRSRHWRTPRRSHRMNV
jgi:hypothetical protein